MPSLAPASTIASTYSVFLPDNAGLAGLDMALLPLFDHLSVQHLFSVASLSPSLHGRAVDHLRTRIRNVLRHWVDDVQALRSVMQMTSAVFSGSCVLEIALATSWTANDLDIYVGCEGGLASLQEHFCDREGYTIVSAWDPITNDPPDPASYNGTPPISRIVRLRRTVPNAFANQGISPANIDIIESRTPNPLTPIHHFTSTCVVNWMTFNGLTIAYPQLTFAKITVRRLISHQTPGQVQAHLDKYEARGFVVSPDAVVVDVADGHAGFDYPNQFTTYIPL